LKGVGTRRTANEHGVFDEVTGKCVGIVGIEPAPHLRHKSSPTRTSEIITAGADGNVYFLSATGELRENVRASESPVIALAVSPDGTMVAAAGVRGSVAIIERARRKLVRTLVGPGIPVWSVSFFPDNHTLLTGGADSALRRWDAATGDPIEVVTGRPEHSGKGYKVTGRAAFFRGH
jgi:WD40 repeat protein